MITTIKLRSISSPNMFTIYFFFVARIPEIFSLSKFLVYNKVFLTTVIMLYIRSQDTVENEYYIKYIRYII